MDELKYQRHEKGHQNADQSVAESQEMNPSTSYQQLAPIEKHQNINADTNRHQQQNGEIKTLPTAICVVCGEEKAKMHYGVFACLGCKGFFRRALKKVNEYECLRDNNCTIDKQERNSCRSCRLQKCLNVGMDPAAVRPDRDFVGKQQLSRRLSMSKGRRTQPSSSSNSTEKKRVTGDGGKNWNQRLPVEMRTMLMTLQNIEAKVVHGDTAKDAAEIYPLRINTLREIIEEPTKLHGRRTEMRYEPYRMAKNEEFSVIVYRRLIAAIDWVEQLAERMGGLSAEDRIALVKSCFGPLTLFKCSARTAVVTSNEDMLCLCNFAYVPREISKAYNDAYHLDNGLVERLLNELVKPFRTIHLAEEEIVCVSAIIVLNPMARELSEAAADKVFQLRNRVYSTLYQIIKECRPDCNPNTTFGNLLLYLPIVGSLANAMGDNIRFAQTFSNLGGIPLLTSLFGCFPVEPFMESEMALLGAMKSPSKALKDEIDQGKPNKCVKGSRSAADACTQTELVISQLNNKLNRKRRLAAVSSLDESNEFRLFKAPCSYTLTEMFDDRINEEEEDQQAGIVKSIHTNMNNLKQQMHSSSAHGFGKTKEQSGYWTSMPSTGNNQQILTEEVYTSSRGEADAQQQPQWTQTSSSAHLPTQQIRRLYLTDEHERQQQSQCWPTYDQQWHQYIGDNAQQSLMDSSQYRSNPPFSAPQMHSTSTTAQYKLPQNNSTEL